jgi:hypothetical protein
MIPRSKPKVAMKAKSIPLSSEYGAEFDTVDRAQWHEILNRFSDANLYQTWSYDGIRCGEDNISHLILRSAGKVVAAAQARIARIPVLGRGAAYVRWGPIWQHLGQVADPAIFRNAIRALRNEYVCRRALILRIFPVLFEDDSGSCLDILHEEGYAPSPEKERSRTLLLDIRPPIEDLRKQLSQRWRRCLTKAERNNLEIIEGTDDGLFADFIGLYGEMLRRKKFQIPSDINEFRMIQRDLPDELKMRIFLCRTNGVNSAGGVFTAIGDTGVYLFGATNDQGMENNGSYLVHWKAIQWMKQCGCRYNNLNGINPKKNPGTYVFKEGLAGKSGWDVYYLGRFDCYPGAIESALARAADLALPILKKIRSSITSGGESKPSGP